MITHSLQPSEYDIQREVEALRDIRRRSITPGALTIDPDLPNQSPALSSTYRLGGSSTTLSFSSTSAQSLSTDSLSAEGSTSGDTSDTSNSTSANLTTDDPFHLFWVPASLHPEIAPAEFRAFLKEHARSPPSSDDGCSSVAGSGSLLSSSSSALSRRRSMLSRQYRPTENDGVENEEVVSLARTHSGRFAACGPQLTINDLQKLEELAEQAANSDDPSKLRNILRRSLSLNMSPSALDKLDQLPEGDEADAPIIVPPPGQILRRAARTTKMRKPSLQVEGGKRPRGRVPKRAQTAIAEARTSSDRSSSDHGESIEPSPANRRRTFSDEGDKRPDSFSDEAQIFDAYARDDDEQLSSALSPSPPLTAVELPEISQQESPGLQIELPLANLPPSLFDALGPVIYQPEPQYPSTPETTVEEQLPSRTPSPSPEFPSLATETPAPEPSLPPQAPSEFLSVPAPRQSRKDKDKKSLFKWGGDRAFRKNVKEKDRESKERVNEKEKEKDSGFFGSLFGGSKKKQEETSSSLVPSGTFGRETAQALLGAPKSKGSASPMSPSLSAGIGPNNYSRYPIHVERAIYRLSHIKLANPRRPLYEQVLISNLMFWYLGVINKAQSASAASNGQAHGTQPSSAATAAEQGEGEMAERDRREKEQWEKEKLEKEGLEKEQKEAENKKRESGKRGSLTKTTGAPSGGRRAEIPVKGPQYEMQHRVMEQEYGGYNGQTGAQINRSLSAPGGSGNNLARNPQQSQSPSMQGQSQRDYVYYSTDKTQQRLPPGAMSPEQLMWQQAQMRQQATPASSSNSFPQKGWLPSKETSSLSDGRYNNTNISQDNLPSGSKSERLPGRSLSTSAVPAPSPQVNGRARKGQSASAAIPLPQRQPGSTVEEEDMDGTTDEDIPLAMWQQQQRRR